MLIRLFFACILVFTDLEVLSMLHEVSFHSFNDRDEVQGWVYVPACKPKGIVQVIHGFGEHSRRYFHMIVKFMDAGYIVAADDHVGHGKTAMYNDTWGDWGDAGFHTMMEDEHKLKEIVSKMYPDLPYFLFGHSMGSMVARSYTKRYDNELAGLIVCGSPSYNSANSIGKQIAKCQGHKHGDHYRSTQMQKLAFGTYNKSFGKVSSPNAWICSDTAVVAAYDASPLCNYIFTSNGFYNLFALMDDAYNRKDWHVVNPQLPIWFISGEEDPCLISLRKFNHAVDNMRKVGYVNVTSKLYPHMRHEIVNELDKELTRRGHRFVRYADDCMIFCKSRKSAERTLENITPFIEGKLFLKVNREKT